MNTPLGNSLWVTMVGGRMAFLLMLVSCTDKSPDTDDSVTSNSHSQPSIDDSQVDSSSTLIDTEDTGSNPETGDTSLTLDTGDTQKTIETGDTSDATIDVILSTDRYIDISTGRANSCGVRQDSTVICWGNRPVKIEGEFVSIDSEGAEHCLLTPDTRIECYGYYHELYADTGWYADLPTEEGFVDVEVGQFYDCAVDIEGYVWCWGINDGSHEDFGVVAETPVTNGFIQVAAGSLHACALHETGTVTCWGVADVISDSEVNGVVQISAGAGTLGINKSGEIIVIQTGSFDYVDYPEVRFLQIEVGEQGEVCGVDLANELHCWGWYPTKELLDVPPGQYTKVSVGVAHACAINTDGYVTCWGYDLAGETIPP